MANPSITVSRGPGEPKEYVWSPFVTKLETRLRFAGLAYTTDSRPAPQGPRGKIPFATIMKQNNSGSDTVSDTVLISQKLVTDSMAANLNGKLNASEAAQDLALRALLEDKLYWYLV